MKITKSQLKRIIEEELRSMSIQDMPNYTQAEIDVLRENNLLDDERLDEIAPALAVGARFVGGQIGKKIVIPMLINKMRSSESREEVADFILEIVELAKSACKLNDKIEDKAGGGLGRLGLKIPDFAKGVSGKMCRMGIGVQLAPLTLLASFIRTIDDSVAELLLDIMKMEGLVGSDEEPSMGEEL